MPASLTLFMRSPDLSRRTRCERVRGWCLKTPVLGLWLVDSVTGSREGVHRRVLHVGLPVYPAGDYDLGLSSPMVHECGPHISPWSSYPLTHRAHTSSRPGRRAPGTRTSHAGENRDFSRFFFAPPAAPFTNAREAQWAARAHRPPPAYSSLAALALACLKEHFLRGHLPLAKSMQGAPASLPPSLRSRPFGPWRGSPGFGFFAGGSQPPPC